MSFEKAYRSYEEFEREELRRDHRVDVSYEELLGEFVDESFRDRAERREGLFDSFNDFDD